MIGSRDYAWTHYAVAGSLSPGRMLRLRAARCGGRGGAQGPLELQPEHAKFSVYFNIDNGTGALRGIYTQGNEAVVPIFREWIEPFRSLGMTHGDHPEHRRARITSRSTASGLPGFQFIQDEVEYNAITHHTNMDTYERLQPRDNIQMATIVAGFRISRGQPRRKDAAQTAAGSGPGRWPRRSRPAVTEKG